MNERKPGMNEGKNVMSDTEQNINDQEIIEIEIPDLTPDSEGGEADLVMEDPFNPSDINIISKPDTLRNLIERLKFKEIDMNPDFQRHADLWDNSKMSRLIESILIRFPLPAFYFDASNEDRWLIVDGLQRLSAIKKFVVDKKLKLRGLEYLEDFKGKGYDELPRTYKRRIDECPVTLFLIQPGTPDPVKYSVFRRINTGGLVLNNQEIRNAMTKPEIRTFLDELAADKYLKKTIGDQSKRMVDQEFVLRFLAFRFMDYEQSKKNIATFLDEMVGKLENSSSDEREWYQQSFHKAVKRCWLIFQESAFEKSNSDGNAKRRRKNSTLFEVWTNAMAILSEEDMEKLMQNRGLLNQKHLDLLVKDNDYFRSITYSTQKKDHFRIRKEKVDQLIKEVLDA